MAVNPQRSRRNNPQLFCYFVNIFCRNMIFKRWNIFCICKGYHSKIKDWDRSIPKAIPYQLCYYSSLIHCLQSGNEQSCPTVIVANIHLRQQPFSLSPYSNVGRLNVFACGRFSYKWHSISNSVRWIVFNLMF